LRWDCNVHSMGCAFSTEATDGRSSVSRSYLHQGESTSRARRVKPEIAPALNHSGCPLQFVRIFLPDFSPVDRPSIAHLPRSTLGFFAFRHFGFQVAFVSTQ
jgi:hypothetical protein